MKNILLAVLFFSLGNIFLLAEEKRDDAIGNTLQILENTTPEQEYNLGKKFASELIQDKIYYSKSKRVIYLNSIVNTLALASDRPYLYDGYKVIVVENKTINAFAYPGGIIVVHDGLFKYLKNEDQLAVILAHEIGHVQEKHNMDSQKNFKIEDALTIASSIGIGKNINNKYAQSLTMGVFKELATSITNGYGVEQEAEADELGIKIMVKAGYDPNEFINVLKLMKEITNNYGGANYPKDRLERLTKIIETLDYDKNEVLISKKIRTKRYKKYK